MKWQTLSPDGKTVCLRKFEGDFGFMNGKETAQVPNRSINRGLYIDTETTGLLHESDEIIEIACREFTFDPATGTVQDVMAYYQGFQQPREPLKTETKIITGLTDKDLEGQQIRWEMVSEMIERAQLVLAHNAGFDRPFVDKKCEMSKNRIWGCTSEQIGWLERHEYPSKKLELLCHYHGFFTDAHRALNDVNAMLYILTMKQYLWELISDIRQPMVKVQALNSPFPTKDLLKSRGYSWDPNRKTWHTTIPEANLATEIEFLETQVYMNRFPGKVTKLKASERFKAA